MRFLKSFIKDPMVGAVTRSSRFVVRKVVSGIKPGSEFIVEYGPGDGAATVEILKVLPPGGKLEAIERNNDFYGLLKARIKDPRFRLVNGCITYLRALLKYENTADAVVSNVPLTFFGPAEKERIIRQTHRLLRPGGTFIVYQYSPLIRPALKKIFKKVSTLFEPRNFPPYFIMIAEK